LIRAIKVLEAINHVHFVAPRRKLLDRLNYLMIVNRLNTN